MKIIHQNEVEIFKDGSVFSAQEYGTNDPDINVARIEINGRFPVSGSMRNTKVKELIYIENGEGEISINGNLQKVIKGDVVFLEPGEWIIWNGNFTLIISCSPAWSKEQHEFLK